MDQDRFDPEAAEFLQGLGAPWRSACGRVTVVRGHMIEYDGGAFVEPAYDYWTVSYRADSGARHSIVLADQDLKPVEVADRVQAQIRKYQALRGSNP